MLLRANNPQHRKVNIEGEIAYYSATLALALEENEKIMVKQSI